MSTEGGTKETDRQPASSRQQTEHNLVSSTSVLNMKHIVHTEINRIQQDL